MATKHIQPTTRTKASAGPQAKPAPAERLLLTVAEAATVLGFERSHIYRLLRRDPTFPRLMKLGRSTRLSVEELRAWVRRKSAQAAEEDAARRAKKARSPEKLGYQ